jgi:hypothetical protein
MHKVKLLKPHTHASRQYQAGDEIEVSAPVRDWLAARGIVAEAEAPAPKTKPAQE